MDVVVQAASFRSLAARRISLALAAAPPRFPRRRFFLTPDATIFFGPERPRSRLLSLASALRPPARLRLADEHAETAPGSRPGALNTRTIALFDGQPEGALAVKGLDLNAAARTGITAPSVVSATRPRCKERFGSPLATASSGKNPTPAGLPITELLLARVVLPRTPTDRPPVLSPSFPLLPISIPAVRISVPE